MEALKVEEAVRIKVCGLRAVGEARLPRKSRAVWCLPSPRRSTGVGSQPWNSSQLLAEGLLLDPSFQRVIRQGKDVLPLDKG